jgi:hypothetical protein
VTVKPAEIDAVVERVMAELRQGRRGRHGPPPEAAPGPLPPQPAQPPHHGGCLFDDVDAAVGAAREAHRRLRSLPLALRERMVAHIRRAMRTNAQPLAYEAWT